MIERKNMERLRHRCVGVDYGTKRVGLAISDPLWVFAQPLGTFSPKDAVRNLKELDRKEGIAVVVVGWPLMPDGSEGRATKAVEGFIRKIRKSISSIAIVKWDERYTSEVARDRVREAGPRRKWRGTKGRLDTAAASIILQEYLDERARRHEPSGSPDDGEQRFEGPDPQPDETSDQ